MAHQLGRTELTSIGPSKSSLGELPYDDFSDYPVLTLLNEVRSLMNQARAVQYRLVAVLRELDARDSLDGTPLHLSRWLHDHFGLTFGVAREKVRRVKQNACLDNVQSMIRSRALSTHWDESGMLIVQGRLTPEQGGVFLKALAKATEASREQASREQATEAKDGARDNDQTDTGDDTYWARRADALTHLMADSLAGTSTHSPGDRCQLMVHVSAEPV